LHTDVAEDGKFERLVTLYLDEPELEDAKNQAARKLSRELKIKGFRPGKAPRSIVERMVGAEALRTEALEDALPSLVGTALDDISLDPVTAPQISEIRDGEAGGVEVEVRVTLWPTIDDVPDVARKIQVEVPVVEEDELQAQIDRVRSQYAELEDVHRPADEGDFVMINLSAHHNGKTLEEVGADDLLYEVGSQSFIPGLDPLLLGAATGAINEGAGTLPEGFGEHAGEEVTLRVLVKGVKARKLPELTDEWVSDVSEFETADELIDQLRRNLQGMKLNAATGVYRENLIDALVEELDVELPDALVEAELESSVHNLAHSLQAQGLDLGTYLSVTGQDQQEFVDELRQDAVRSLRTRILLEGVAKAEGISTDDADYDEALEGMARSSGRSADELREVLAANGQDSALAGDILRRKALDRILESSTPVDADGNPVDLSLPADEEDGESEEEAPAESLAGHEEAGPDADEDS